MHLGIAIWMLISTHGVIADSALTCEALDVFHGYEQERERFLVQTKAIRAPRQDTISNLTEASALEASKPTIGGKKRSRAGDRQGDEVEQHKKKDTETNEGAGWWYSAWEPALVIGGGFMFIGSLVVFRIHCTYEPEKKGDNTNCEAFLDRQRDNEALDNDAYSLAISSLIWDSYMTAIGYRRVGRVAQSLLLIGLNIGIQIYVMMGIKRWASSKAVHDIRHVYDVFEVHMYGGKDHTPPHLTVDGNGDHRGIQEFFDPDLFASLPRGMKDEVCAIPFSQPAFFIVALFIWTLTCFSEVKTTVELFVSLILRTPRLDSMSVSLSPADEEKRQVVQGLTTTVKTVICSCILVPRLGITLLLLWLGCRWLAATNNFMDLILNAVALEFILLMKDLVYQTLVPEWNKHDVERIEIAPPTQFEPQGHWALLGTIQWASLSLLWVLIYVYFLQNVLPDYRWDVRDVCTSYIRSHYGI